MGEESERVIAENVHALSLKLLLERCFEVGEGIFEWLGSRCFVRRETCVVKQGALPDDLSLNYPPAS